VLSINCCADYLTLIYLNIKRYNNEIEDFTKLINFEPNSRDAILIVVLHTSVWKNAQKSKMIFKKSKKKKFNKLT